MKYTVKRSFVEVVGTIWMPSTQAVYTYDLRQYDIDNMRDDDGKITREEGIALVKKFDGEFPQRHFAEFLEYCAMDEGKFHSIINKWKKPHVWDGDKLRKPIWLQDPAPR